MDSDQRLQELHKAYADKMLDASKEADAKVMAAEMKAQRLEHELQVTKYEAVQMMVRLKKIMDDKISEAKMTSWNQQQKNKELEAQLHEAEDIVTELREELRHVQDKCERKSGNDVQPLDKHEHAPLKEAFEDNRQSQSLSCHPLQLEKDSVVASNKENLYLNQGAGYHKYSWEAVQMRNLYGAMSELPSILRRNSEDKFYRNGSTLRIHTCKRNILDSEMSLSRQPNDASGEEEVEGAKKDTRIRKVTTDGAQNMFNIVRKEKEAVYKNGCISCQYEVQANDMIQKTTKTATNSKYRKKNPALNKKIPDKLFRKLHETPCVSLLNHTPNSVENSSAQIPVDLLVPIVQEGASRECLDIQVSKSNLNKDDESISPPELKTIGSTSEGCSLQLFKYTFKRKRKRETVRISDDGNVSAEKFTPDRKKEKKYISVDQEKCSLVAESHLVSRQ